MDMLLSEDVRSFWEACTLTFTPGVLELQEFTGGDARPNSTNGNSLLITGVNYISTYVHGSMTIPYSTTTLKTSCLSRFESAKKKNIKIIRSYCFSTCRHCALFSAVFCGWISFTYAIFYYCLIWQYIQVKKSGFPPARLVLLKVSRHLGLPRYLLLPTRKVDGLSDPAGL